MNKVALIYSGQVRKISPTFFREGLKLFTEGTEFDIYLNYWDEMGKSMNHDPYDKKLILDDSADILVNDLFKDLPVAYRISEPYVDFEKNIPKSHLKIHKDSFFSAHSKHTLPQIYSFCKLFDSCRGVLINYDLIFSCRFDTVFTHRLIDSDLKKFNTNTLYHLNYGKAYYPKRIYAIFFGGDFSAMNQLSKTWINIPTIVNDAFDNGLEKNDVCRVLYLSAIMNSIKINSLHLRSCEVHRFDTKRNYVIWLANSGIAKPSKDIFKMVESWKIFYFWSVNYCKVERYFSILLITFDLLRLVGIDLFSFGRFIRKSKYLLKTLIGDGK